MSTLQAQVASLTSHVCPLGYTNDTTVTTYTVCKKGADEMVKVGTGMSAFWIDRYEASVWSNADGTGSQYGAIGSTGTLVSPDYPDTFRRTVQRSPPSLRPMR